MNIIEQEIAKRQAVVDSKAEKLARLEELRAEFERLSEEIANINTEVLEAEIAELKTYLPRVDEEVVEPATDDVQE